MSTPLGFGSRLFVTGALAFVVTGMLSALFGLVLPVYDLRFGLGENGGTLLLSIYGLGAFLAVVAGLFNARLLTLRGGLAALALGIGLMALQVSWPMILLGGGLAGVGFGMVAVEVNRQFLADFAERGPGMVAVVNAVFGLGSIISPFLFTWAGGGVGLVFAGIALLAVVVVPAVIPDTRAGPGPANNFAPPNLRQWPLLILAFNSLSAVVEVGLIGLGPSALLSTGLDSVSVARLMSAYALLFLLGRLGLYWLTRMFATDLLFLIALTGSGLALGIAAAGWPSTGFVLSGSFTALYFPTFYVWAIGVLRDARMGSAILCSGLVMVSICPVVLGLILDRIGIGQLFMLLSGLGMLLALAFVPTLLWARRTQP